MKTKTATKTSAVLQKGNKPELDKFKGRVLAKDKYEKAVQSLKGAKFPAAE